MKTSLSNFLMPAAFVTLACLPALVSATNPYQMAVIEATPGAMQLQQGETTEGLTALKTQSRNSDAFSQTMALCVANTQLANLNGASPACSRAIQLARHQAQATPAERREMQALALSNRGVMHWVAQDLPSAQQDFQRAAKLSNNELVQHNLQQFSSRLEGLIAQR